MNNNLSKIITLINSNNFQKAELMVSELLENNPDDFTLNKMLGLSLLGQKKYSKALAAFNICDSLNQSDYDVNVNLSFLFLKVQEYALSIKYSELAMAADQYKPSCYHNLAECYLALGQFTKAKENVLIAIKYRGGINSNDFLRYPDLMTLYTDILLANHDDSELEEFCLNILDKGYFHSGLFDKLLNYNQNKISKRHLETLNTVIASNNFKNNIEKNAFISAALFSLAKYYGKNKDKKLSEKYFIDGNKVIASMQRQSLFDRQKTYFECIKFVKNFNFETIKGNIPKSKGDGLIFIFGMPRSGTTLTESIISTAKNVKAGGEKVFFNVQLYQKIKNLNNLNIDLKFFQDLGDNYLKNIELHKGGMKFFIDKMPENYLYFKFIKSALPGAKFIHVYRNPWDNAISLFKEYYADNVYFASSFFGIATEYANYQSIMKFWKSIEEENCLLDICYEDLVKNTESKTNEIWDYCHLEGEYSPSLRKTHFANTASKQQVTKDIYQSSLKKSDFAGFEEQFYNDLQQQIDYWDKRLDGLKYNL